MPLAFAPGCRLRLHDSRFQGTIGGMADGSGHRPRKIVADPPFHIVTEPLFASNTGRYAPLTTNYEAKRVLASFYVRQPALSLHDALPFPHAPVAFLPYY